MRILFCDGTKGHNPKERTKKPTGGILNSLTLVAEYLASKGHDVYVNSRYDKTEDINGVHYIVGRQDIPKWDITIFNRDFVPQDFLMYCRAHNIKCIWWLHDLVQIKYLQHDVFNYMDKIVALSNYCKDTYSDFYSIADEKFVVIPNGIDSKLFYPGEYEKRDSNLVITASALVKGYLPIPTVYENLKRENHSLDFRIYSSQTLHGFENNPKQQGYLKVMGDQGAHVYSPVSPEVLAHIMRKAWCLLMPNSYPEICSNLLLQARASGCPVVTSNIGSAPEFIEHGVTGLMTTKYSPHDMFSWIIEYTNLVLDICGDKVLHKKISENAPQGILTFDQVGEKWNELLIQLMA